MTLADSFVERWIWPAGGSGGIPGDVVGTLVWVVIAGVATAIFWPPLRHAIERLVHRGDAELHASLAELHRKADHIIHFHPEIPELPPKETA